jgi:hypothetical protein
MSYIFSSDFHKTIYENIITLYKALIEFIGIERNYDDYDSIDSESVDSDYDDSINFFVEQIPVVSVDEYLSDQPGIQLVDTNITKDKPLDKPEDKQLYVLVLQNTVQDIDWELWKDIQEYLTIEKSISV